MNRIPILILLLTTTLFGSAKRIKINENWQFQRVNTAEAGAVKNQGADWSSQYDVEHISTSSNILSINPDSVRIEMNALGNTNWESISLPHTPFVEKLTVLHQWQGICYYRKNIYVDKSSEGKRLWLEFGGAMHIADLWINGRYVVRHTGGYLPFSVDVTNLLNYGGENEITVRLDNRDNPLIPPGKPLNKLDFCYYGGLYRDVTLTEKSVLHITDPTMAETVAGGGIFVRYPQVCKEKATVEIKTQIENSGKEYFENIQIVSSIHEWDNKKGIGRKVGYAKSEPLYFSDGMRRDVVHEIEIKNPHLWSPDSPSRYCLISEVIKDGKVIDREETKIGIRNIEFSRERGFLINGQPLELIGTNRHMEYPYVGNAVPANAQRRDIYQIKSYGFNIVRLGHYPQDPSVLDACDEIGLLAIEPIPGWQFFNQNETFINHTYNDIRHLIRRDRNHPSIVMWETTLNESWPTKEWKDGAVRTAHEEYPGNQCFTSGDAYGYDGFDVCYNDWREGFNRPNTTSKPSFIREYYDYEFGGHYSTTRIGRGDGHKALLTNAWNAQWSFNRYKRDYPTTAGSAVWSMYDYNRGCCDNICKSGTADIFRLPKYSSLFFRSQVKPGTPLPEGAMPHEVFIAAMHDPSASVDTLQVYGNVDEVELFNNGVSLGRRRHDNGASTGYVSMPDGGNCENLTFPPFTFTNVGWESGSLEAYGYKNGKKVASHKLTAPGDAARLDISYFESGVPASGSDLLIVYVTLTDKKGNPLTHINGLPISLETDGINIVQGPDKTPAEAGTASFLVRTAKDAKRLSLRASAGTISGSKKIQLSK